MLKLRFGRKFSMKKLVQMLVMLCMVVFATQVAFAHADKETIPEGADLASIHRLAVAYPKYVPVGEKDPTTNELAGLIYEASKVARCYVVSYDAVAEGIRMDKNLDIKALDVKKAEKAFKENVSKYADAYVEVWVANNSRTKFFFDVHKSGTNESLYVYEIQANKSDKDDAKTFTVFAEQFYKHFEHAANDQQKKAAKAGK